MDDQDLEHGKQGEGIPCRAGGFTLLEVVVAVALLGMVLAAAFEITSVGLRSARTSGEYTQAVVLAKRKLADLALHEVKAQTEEGIFGAYRWRTEVAPEGDSDESQAARLYRLRVKVSWAGQAGDKGVELVTLRAVAVKENLLQAAPSPPSSMGQGDGGIRGFSPATRRGVMP